jgi:ketosteroid isomerase-like protein
MTRFLALLATLFFAVPALAQSPRAAADELLAADRAFSAAAATASDPAAALGAMFDSEVWMPVGGRAHSGRAGVLAAVRAAPAYAQGHMRWTPVRVGVSADGTQGFTFGYLDFDAGEPARRARRYLAYWVRRPDGWRVVAYKQAPRAAGEVSRDMLPPSLPAASARNANPADTARHQASLAAAEQAFSDQAQRVGLRAAFREYGRDDAMNMGAGSFVMGAEAISQAVGGEETTSPVRWSTTSSFVAASGDLGVSIGTISRNGAVPEGQPAEFPFFTVWRRDGPNAPWRYIAE